MGGYGIFYFFDKKLNHSIAIDKYVVTIPIRFYYGEYDRFPRVLEVLQWSLSPLKLFSKWLIISAF